MFYISPTWSWKKRKMKSNICTRPKVVSAHRQSSQSQQQRNSGSLTTAAAQIPSRSSSSSSLKMCGRFRSSPLSIRVSFSSSSSPPVISRSYTAHTHFFRPFFSSACHRKGGNYHSNIRSCEPPSAVGDFRRKICVCVLQRMEQRNSRRNVSIHN